MTNDKKQILPFDFEGNQIEVVIHDDEPTFVLADVCKTLELQNPSQYLDLLDDDEKLTYKIYRSGQKRKVNVITESGLYSLIF